MPFIRRDFSIAPASSAEFPSDAEWLILTGLTGSLSVLLDQDSTGYDSDLFNSFSGKFAKFTLQNSDPANTVTGTAWTGMGPKPDHTAARDTSKNTKSQNDIVGGANALTQLFAPESDVLRVHIVVPVDATGPVRIGPANIGGSSGGLAGMWLYPGQTLELRNRGALYAYNANGAGVSIGVLTETL